MQEAFAVITAAEEAIERERRAVLRLQAISRCWNAQKMFRILRRAVLSIQRVFRGFKGRCRALERVLEKAAFTELQVYHHCATVVQARVRGYLTRLKVADFYKQKRYLAAVEQKSQEVLLAAHEHATRQAQVVEEQRKEEIRKRFEATAHGLHHLLSTASTRGILKRHNEAESQMTVFGGPIEDAIRGHQAPRRKFKRDLPSITAIVTDGYEDAKELNAMTKLLDDKMRTRLHNAADFYVRKPLAPAYVTNIIQPAVHGVRMRWREEDKDKRIVSK